VRVRALLVCARVRAIRETVRRARDRHCMLPQTPELQAGPFDTVLLISCQSVMHGPSQRFCLQISGTILHNA